MFCASLRKACPTDLLLCESVGGDLFFDLVLCAGFAGDLGVDLLFGVSIAGDLSFDLFWPLSVAQAGTYFVALSAPRERAERAERGAPRGRGERRPHRRQSALEEKCGKDETHRFLKTIATIAPRVPHRASRIAPGRLHRGADRVCGPGGMNAAGSQHADSHRGCTRAPWKRPLPLLIHTVRVCFGGCKMPRSQAPKPSPHQRSQLGTSADCSTVQPGPARRPRTQGRTGPRRPGTARAQQCTIFKKRVALNLRRILVRPGGQHNVCASSRSALWRILFPRGFVHLFGRCLGRNPVTQQARGPATTPTKQSPRIAEHWKVAHR